jgi:cold shock CspA family protein
VPGLFHMKKEFPMPSTTSQRIVGRLKFYVLDRGFGFIRRAGEADIFFHVDELELDAQGLKEDDALEFEVQPGRDGRLRAVRIRWAAQE